MSESSTEPTAGQSYDLEHDDQDSEPTMTAPTEDRPVSPDTAEAAAD